MRKIFVLLLAVTLAASAVASAVPDASQPKKQEQRKSKKAEKKTEKQVEISRAFEILKSGRFKISFLLPRKDLPIAMNGVGYELLNGAMARSRVLDIQDPNFSVKSAEIDSTKNTYVIIFAYKYDSKYYYNYSKIIYNFKTGCLRAYGETGNYTNILPLDQ